ncbi:SDR family oxidoreductase [Arthrobacter sp. PAMC25564]|uniref:SDR family NAD(P)-dependent oxidoreductase n=1 Tax=Arthrobacter sp. PAMC25564 TaxID=2565366 RepID=UPI0010A29E34|nr:SDR family oxidoreductase [Arthrobacter sp. PAMC25564]QCB96297.1 SDR family oxidoreductase [Arthrobacter sp. PAMC25564]
MSGLFDLTGKVALVVGAGAGGLGERIAAALADQGASLALADRAERAADLAATALRCGTGVSTSFCDVTDEAQISALFDAVISAHGRVDILVNAAGVMLRKAYDETSLDEFQRVIGVNLTGTWLLNREAGRRMSPQGSGKIVNLSTVYAERVGPVPESAYYASKAGIANVTRALASELGPHGITVNCVAPGVFYPTQMTAALSESPDQLDWFARRTMLGRLGDPEQDIAGPVVLLASAASAYMTGQVIYVDGGWSAW